MSAARDTNAGPDPLAQTLPKDARPLLQRAKTPSSFADSHLISGRASSPWLKRRYQQKEELSGEQKLQAPQAFVPAQVFCPSPKLLSRGSTEAQSSTTGFLGSIKPRNPQ